MDKIRSTSVPHVNADAFELPLRLRRPITLPLENDNPLARERAAYASGTALRPMSRILARGTPAGQIEMLIRLALPFSWPSHSPLYTSLLFLSPSVLFFLFCVFLFFLFSSFLSLSFLRLSVRSLSKNQNTVHCWRLK